MRNVFLLVLLDSNTIPRSAMFMTVLSISSLFIQSHSPNNLVNLHHHFMDEHQHPCHLSPPVRHWNLLFRANLGTNRYPHPPGRCYWISRHLRSLAHLTIIPWPARQNIRSPLNQKLSCLSVLIHLTWLTMASMTITSLQITTQVPVRDQKFHSLFDLVLINFLLQTSATPHRRDLRNPFYPFFRRLQQASYNLTIVCLLLLRKSKQMASWASHPMMQLCELQMSKPHYRSDTLCDVATSVSWSHSH